MTFEIICVANWQTFIEWANALAGSLRRLGHEATVSNEEKHGDADFNIYFTGNRRFNLNGADRHKAHILYQVEERWQDREAEIYEMHWGWDGCIELYEEHWIHGRQHGVSYCPVGYAPEFGGDKMPVPIEHDGFFFGSMSQPRRHEWTGLLSKHFNLVAGDGFFLAERENLVKSSAINLYIKHKDQWSFGQHHCMLILVFSKFILVDESDCGWGHFKEGVHYIGCSSKEDMLDKFGYYLKHDEEREEFAANALADMKKNHSYEDILAEVFKSRFDGGELKIKRGGI